MKYFRIFVMVLTLCKRLCEIRSLYIEFSQSAFFRRKFNYFVPETVTRTVTLLLFMI